MKDSEEVLPSSHVNLIDLMYPTSEQHHIPKIASKRLKMSILFSSEGHATFCETASPRTMESDSDVEEDTRSSKEFLADLNLEFHDRALLANQKRFYKRSGRDEESLSSEDEGTTTVKAFMAIAKDEPTMGKTDS
ncbi:hypothetical protein Tco_1170577 [Tanacetum coccineum]